MLQGTDVLEIFHVDFEVGKLFWKTGPKNHPRLAGKEAGFVKRSNNGKHYWVIKINGRHHKRSRLMFLAFNGHLPHPCVDHRNGNSLDDRPNNLREATVAQNAQNHKSRARRINLPMGVRKLARGGYQARISLDKKQIALGAYSTPEEAHHVYMAKRKELFGEFA